MRHVFQTPRWADSIAYSVVVDGAGADTVVAEALGSRRFEVIARGPGGHSWSDFGTPSPIITLARAIQALSETPVPTSPKTTFNVGVIRGGTSVNSIPESASMRVDLRSTSMTEIDRLERAMRIALDHAVDAENQPAAARNPRRAQTVQYEVVEIGNRPAGELAADFLSRCAHDTLADSAGVDGCEYSAVAGARGDCDWRRGHGRRGAHVARMVRLPGTGPGAAANSAYNAGIVGARREGVTARENKFEKAKFKRTKFGKIKFENIQTG